MPNRGGGGVPASLSAGGGVLLGSIGVSSCVESRIFCTTHSGSELLVNGTLGGGDAGSGGGGGDSGGVESGGGIERALSC